MRVAALCLAISLASCASLSPFEIAFSLCKDNKGFYSLDYSKRTGHYRVTCRDMVQFKF